MSISVQTTRGLTKYLVDTDVAGRLGLHITLLPPGASPHPPHTHDAAEGFYILEGNGTVEVEGQKHLLGPNEAIIVDCRKMHGITNTGEAKLRYVVVTAKG